MVKKPTYRESEQRIKELEAEVIKHKYADIELLNSQAVFENIQVGLHIYHLEDINDDKTLKMISSNQAAAGFTGVSAKDIVGKTLDENFPGLRDRGIPQIYAEVIRSGKSRILEDVYYGDNRVIQGVFSVKAFPLPNNCVGVSFENITERRKAEEALKESEEKYRLIFETMTEGVCLHEIIYDETNKAIDYKILDVNPSYEAITGMMKERVVGSNASDLYGTGEPPFIDIYAKVADTGEATTFEIFWQPMEKHFQISVISPYKGKFATVFTDLTGRKQAEEALRLERDRAQAYLDTVEAIIVALDTEGRITLINQKGCRLFGSGEDDLMGQHWFSTCLPHPDGMENVYPVFLKLIAGEIEAAEYFENPIVTRSGDLRNIAWHNALMRDEQGRIIGILSAGEDITARKQAEKALADSEEKYRELFSTVSDPIMLFDAETRQFVDINDAALKLYGIIYQKKADKFQTGQGQVSRCRRFLSAVAVYRMPGLIKTAACPLTV